MPSFKMERCPKQFRLAMSVGGSQYSVVLFKIISSSLVNDIN